jgi:hypothetical protein
MKHILPLLALLTLVISCKDEELHPDLGFLPCAQVLFADTIWERDLNMGIAALQGNLLFTVNSPVGLRSVKVRLVNRMSASVVDTVQQVEFGQFDDPLRFEGSYGITLAGNTIGVSVLTSDLRNQQSERVMQVAMKNPKPAPDFRWTSADCKGQAIGAKIDVRTYDNTCSQLALNAHLESYTSVTSAGKVKSWGINKVDVYVQYSNGEELRLDAPSKDFTDGTALVSCPDCRYDYDFSIRPEWARADGSTVTQIRLVAEDLRYQRTKAAVAVKVYTDYAEPEIIFDDDEILVASDATATPPIAFLARSYDVRLWRLTYYAVRADGSADSVGSNRGQINVLDPDLSNGGYSQHSTSFVLSPYTSDVVAFRVSALNRQNKTASRDIPIRPIASVEGLTQVFHQVAFSSSVRASSSKNPTARPCVYSIAAQRTLLDAEVSEANPPSIVFACASSANIYPVSPHSSAPSGSTWSSRTRFIKKTAADFDNATQASLEAMFSDLMSSKGEYSVTSANRCPASLVGIAKSVTVTDGQVVVVQSDADNNNNTMVSYPPDMWALVKTNSDENRSPVWYYERMATREDAAINVAYAFATQDSIVGIMKIEEAFAFSHYPSSPNMGWQRITFSVKHAKF